TQVLNALKGINQHKAAGIDKISARLLITAAPDFPSTMEDSESHAIIQEWQFNVFNLIFPRQSDNNRINESSTAYMHHGVPQGSILGPLFFMLFINDLPLHVTSDIDLYADDTTVTASADFKEIAQLNTDLSKSVNEIHHWPNTNKLPLNEEKTKVMIITGNRLAFKVKVADELSVMIDGDKILKNTNTTTVIEIVVFILTEGRKK
ncbi:Hypothetical predicted protein, partial [Paramuricea clavata]